MGVVLGIDIGGSTTKIAGFQESGQHIGTLRVEASDRLTSLIRRDRQLFKHARNITKRRGLLRYNRRWRGACERRYIRHTYRAHR